MLMVNKFRKNVMSCSGSPKKLYSHVNTVSASGKAANICSTSMIGKEITVPSTKKIRKSFWITYKITSCYSQTNMSKIKQINYNEMMAHFNAPDRTPKSSMLIKLRTCGVKKGFVTVELANKQVQRISRDKNQKFKSYKCPYCKWFHVAHDRGL